MVIRVPLQQKTESRSFLLVAGYACLPGCSYGHMPATPVHQGQTLNEVSIPVFSCPLLSLDQVAEKFPAIIYHIFLLYLDGSAGVP